MKHNDNYTLVIKNKHLKIKHEKSDAFNPNPTHVMSIITFNNLNLSPIPPNYTHQHDPS